LVLGEWRGFSPVGSAWKERPSSMKVNPRLQAALLLPLVALAWLALLGVVGWLLSHITRALLLVILGGLIAFALTPLINLLVRFMPRVLAIAVAYVAAFVVLLGLLGVVVATAANELSGFVGHLPDYQRQAQGLQPAVIGILKPFGITPQQVMQVEAQLVSGLKTLGTTAANDAVGVVEGVLGGVVDGILILILSVYLAASGPRLAMWMRKQAPAGQRRSTAELIGIVNQVVGGYVRGTLVLATLVGVLVGVGMALLHVRYALLLGILAFFMEFVPVLGVMVSGAVCVIVALFSGWVTALLVVGYFAVVHVIEGDVVGPRIMGKAVGIHPGVAIVALVAGSELFGIWGALFGAPLAGLLQAVVVVIFREIRLANARDARTVAEAREAEEEGDAVAAGRYTTRAGALLSRVAKARDRLRPAR
jgi:predicted PurR-regulated permease PerM